MKIELTEKKIIGISIILIIAIMMFACYFCMMEKLEVINKVYDCIDACLIKGGNIDGLCFIDCLP